MTLNHPVVRVKQSNSVFLKHSYPHQGVVCIRIYLCVSIYLQVCVYMCEYSENTSIYSMIPQPITYMYVSIYLYVSIYSYVCVYINTYMSKYVRDINRYQFIHMYTQVIIYMHASLHVYARAQNDRIHSRCAPSILKCCEAVSCNILCIYIQKHK